MYCSRTRQEIWSWQSVWKTLQRTGDKEERGNRLRCILWEDLLQPYNNLIYACDDDSSDEDDDDQTENENHNTNENVTDRSNRQNELPDHNKFTHV